MQGWRKTMEGYLETHDFPKFPHIKLLGVFDGHGGPWIAEHAGTRIAEVFEKHLEVRRRASPRASLSFEMSPRASSLGLKRAPVPVGCEGAVTAARAAALSFFETRPSQRARGGGRGPVTSAHAAAEPRHALPISSGPPV